MCSKVYLYRCAVLRYEPTHFHSHECGDLVSLKKNNFRSLYDYIDGLYEISRVEMLPFCTAKPHDCIPMKFMVDHCGLKWKTSYASSMINNP